MLLPSFGKIFEDKGGTFLSCQEFRICVYMRICKLKAFPSSGCRCNKLLSSKALLLFSLTESKKSSKASTESFFFMFIQVTNDRISDQTNNYADFKYFVSNLGLLNNDSWLLLNDIKTSELDWVTSSRACHRTLHCHRIVGRPSSRIFPFRGIGARCCARKCSSASWKSCPRGDRQFHKLARF